MKEKIPFSIDHMDPLGQGVSKQNNQIIFIPKTLPGEKGFAEIIKKNKKISFAQTNIDNITQKSSLRITPACPHFAHCGGCHYLHTSYTQEIIFKENALKWLLKGLLNQSCLWQTHEAGHRSGYRNRIQLHYNKQRNLIGFVNRSLSTITPIPKCILPLIDIQKHLSSLYANNSWTELVSGEPNEGHLELFFTDEKIQISTNKPYSFGGFKQVNTAMNHKLLNLIKSKYDEIKNTFFCNYLADLFGGNGNLSQQLSVKNNYVIDIYHTPISDNIANNFINLDLHSNGHIEKLKNLIPQIDLLILDPPRSGYTELSHLCSQYNPSFIFYVSCNPSTLVRDIRNIISKYQICEIHLLDFFPSTYHFETLCILKKLI